MKKLTAALLTLTLILTGAMTVLAEENTANLAGGIQHDIDARQQGQAVGFFQKKLWKHPLKDWILGGELFFLLYCPFLV